MWYCKAIKWQLLLHCYQNINQAISVIKHKVHRPNCLITDIAWLIYKLLTKWRVINVWSVLSWNDKHDNALLCNNFYDYDRLGEYSYLSNCYIHIRVISYLLSNSWAYPSTWLSENFFCLITDFLEVSSIWRSLTSCVKIFVETKFSTNQCPGNLVQMFIWYRQNLSETDLKIPPSIIRACTV